MTQNINPKGQLLEFHYAQIDPSTGRCINVFTSSYQIPLPDEYILIPVFTDAYEDKYYDAETGNWYYDQEHTQIFEP